jgi:HD-like signal output (HDOD) protein
MDEKAIRSARELTALIDSIPSLPATFQRINEAVNDPDATAQTIARLVETDQALTARLLRLANGPLYGHPGHIETVGQAVMILGTRPIRDLTLATAVFANFAGIPDDLVDMDSFWRHSLAVGIAAKALMTRRGDKNAERFFVSGLLHDVGSLVLYQKMPERARGCLETARKTGDLLHLVEFRSLGFDHADVGGALLESWKLPVNLAEPVRNHHRFLLSSRAPLENAVVHVADIIACALDLGSNGEHLVPPLEPAAWDFIGLAERHVAAVVGDVERQFVDMAKVFLA